MAINFVVWNTKLQQIKQFGNQLCIEKHKVHSNSVANSFLKKITCSIAAISSFWSTKLKLNQLVWHPHWHKGMLIIIFCCNDLCYSEYLITSVSVAMTFAFGNAKLNEIFKQAALYWGTLNAPHYVALQWKLHLFGLISFLLEL